MTATITLGVIIDAILLQAEDTSSYLNRGTGAVVVISDREMRAAEEGASPDWFAEWQRDNVRIAEEILEDEEEATYIPAPSRFDIDEYRIMEGFCRSVVSAEVSDQLYDAMKGKGAFRRFKDKALELGVAEEWYKHRDEEFRRIAIGWCERNGVAYHEE